MCEHGGASSYHLVHDLCHPDHLVLVVEYRHAENAGRVVAGLLVNQLIEARILSINQSINLFLSGLSSEDYC